MVDSSNRGLREVHEMSQRGSSVASPSGDKFHYKAFPSLMDTNSLPPSCRCIASIIHQYDAHPHITHEGIKAVLEFAG